MSKSELVSAVAVSNLRGRRLTKTSNYAPRLAVIFHAEEDELAALSHVSKVINIASSPEIDGRTSASGVSWRAACGCASKEEVRIRAKRRKVQVACESGA